MLMFLLLNLKYDIQQTIGVAWRKYSLYSIKPQMMDVYSNCTYRMPGVGVHHVVGEQRRHCATLGGRL